MAAASPLGGLEWEKIAPVLEGAGVRDALSDQCCRDAEKAATERNRFLPAVNGALRDVLPGSIGAIRRRPGILGSR